MRAEDGEETRRLPTNPHIAGYTVADLARAAIG